MQPHTNVPAPNMQTDSLEKEELAEARLRHKAKLVAAAYAAVGYDDDEDDDDYIYRDDQVIHPLSING